MCRRRRLQITFDMSEIDADAFHHRFRYWFEREFMTYPFQDFDIENEIRPLKDKLILVNGEESPKEPYQVRANLILAEKLGTEVVMFPGEHVGHATNAQDFAKKFLEVMKGR